MATMTEEAVLKHISSLPYEEMLKLLIFYFKNNKNINNKKCASNVMLEQKLIAEGVPVVCPHCGSAHHIKNGRQASGLTCYICKGCGKKFNIFSGTVLEKSRFSWEAWVAVLEMTVNNDSLEDVINKLQKDYGCTGIDYKTAWLWRMKLIHALASIPQPVLTGVIQIDETFPRESQKGSKELINYLPSTYATRVSRKGYRPSKLGVMGPEFCNVVTAIDDSGHCVCKVLSLGRFEDAVFVDAFDKHIYEPLYICSDANYAYERYCKLKGYNHYVLPSSYNKTIEETKGYHKGIALTEEEKQQNYNIKQGLYRNKQLDYITPGCFTYKEFLARKKDFKLSLARVNSLHASFKHFLCIDKRNVSSKYLTDYVGFFSYIHNWKVDNGYAPTSYEDCIKIFIEILKLKNNLQVKGNSTNTVGVS